MTSLIKGPQGTPQFDDYAGLRAYQGKQKTTYVTGYMVAKAPCGIAGMFVRDDTDKASADNGGTVIVSTNGVRWKRADVGAWAAEWFGAVGDGATVNTVAFTALSAAVNAVPLTEKPVSVRFGQGVFLYADGLRFTRPVCLHSNQGATLNYTGNAAAIKLGPDGIANWDVFTQGEYTVEGLRFTGGGACVHGVYANEYVLEPKLRDMTFFDFGNPTSIDIYAQFEDWDIVIEGCKKLTLNNPNATGNFIAVPGRKKDGSVTDGGNSRVTIRDCWATSYAGQEMGYFAYVNAIKSRIIGGGFQHATRGILVGGNGSGTLIDNVYAELSSPTAPFYVEALSEDAGNGHFSSPQQVIIRNGYINMHQEVIGNKGRLIKAGDANVQIKDWTIDGMTISNYADRQPLIEQNNVAGQTGNQYGRIKRYYNPASADDGKRFILRSGYTLAENWSACDTETGAWTPAIGGSATYTTQSGTYRRNGNTVTVTFDMQIDQIGTGDTSKIYGIPYTNSTATQAGSIGFFNGLANYVVSLYARVDGASDHIQFTGLTGANTGTPGALPVFGNFARVIGSVSYVVDEPL